MKKGGEYSSLPFLFLLSFFVFSNLYLNFISQGANPLEDGSSIKLAPGKSLKQHTHVTCGGTADTIRGGTHMRHQR